MIKFSYHKIPPETKNLYDEKLANQLASTHGAISALNQMSRLLHNPNLLMRPILAKEAESSSQLEGTQASIDDAYQIDITEQTKEKRDDAQEIRNYEEAMLTGLEVLRKTKLGISEILIRETHKRLLHGVRGKTKTPGKYRDDEVWIGNLGTNKSQAKYLPPEAVQIKQLMEELIKFINNRKDVHPLIACGIMHHRFEAIHPFKDGNGRVGRLLISLYLIDQGLLKYPILYPSGFFETNKDQYTSSLSKVDKNQDWYQWFIFFLKALEKQAQTSHLIALEIDSLFREARSKTEKERAHINLVRVLEFTFTRPYVTSALLASELDIPRTTCDRYLEKLSTHKIVEFIGVHKRSNVYANKKLLSLLKSI